eukprot:TRINITY_DN7665_c0_g1_i1.p1 TRINITY_DN7665_c0_g1~~TRINITY_DN7665_c0_g1_i1.p1  ORF type:complete len:554 (-),score=92.93 TRINITY_DN7665_c0_g1_i1:154-1815(-)
MDSCPETWSVTDALTCLQGHSRALVLALQRGDVDAAGRTAGALAQARTPLQLRLQAVAPEQQSPLEKQSTAAKASALAPGTRVEYYSQSAGCWVPAMVLGCDGASGTYQLDIHQAAAAAKVRLPKRSCQEAPQVSGPDTAASSSSAPRLAKGDPAEYYSTTYGRWVPAEVLGWDEQRGAYILNIQPIAFPSKVRRSESGSAQAEDSAAAADQFMNCGMCKASCVAADLLKPGCGHRFCGPCLYRHICRGNLCCPSCSVEIPSEQVTSLLGKESNDARLEERVLPERAKSSFACPLCLEQVARDGSIELDCSHGFCTECFRSYLTSKIREAQVADDELVCPLPDCKTEITVAQVQGAVEGSELWDKFLGFRQSLFENGNIVACPTPQCGKFLVEADLDFATCPMCQKEFCLRCGQAKHEGVSCEDFKAWHADNSKADDHFEELLAQQQWRRCPKCRAPSERESGCNFMQCRSAVCRKRTFWCYVCGKQMAKEDHYTHYPRGPYEDDCYTPGTQRLHVASSEQPAEVQGGASAAVAAAAEAGVAVFDALRNLVRA